MSDYMQEAERLVDEYVKAANSDWACGCHDARAALLAHIERGRVPEGMTVVPETASDAMLRPFYECPPDELQLAWQAALLIAQKQSRAAAPAAPDHSGWTQPEVRALATPEEMQRAMSAATVPAEVPRISEDQARMAYWGCYEDGDSDRCSIWMTAFRWHRAQLAAAAAPTEVPEPEADVVEYVARWGGNCRDCADESGVCPGSGLPCGGARKAIEHVIKALQYGVTHVHIANPIIDAREAAGYARGLAANGGAPSQVDAERMGAEGAPADEGERLAFEAWMRGHCWALCATWTGTQYRSDSEQGGEIDPRAMMTRKLWAAWRDRAALAAQKGGA